MDQIRCPRITLYDKIGERWPACRVQLGPDAGVARPQILKPQIGQQPDCRPMKTLEIGQSGFEIVLARNLPRIRPQQQRSAQRPCKVNTEPVTIL